MFHAIETAAGRNEADLKECSILTAGACGSLLVGRQSSVHGRAAEQSASILYDTFATAPWLLSVHWQFHYHNRHTEQVRVHSGVSLYGLLYIYIYTY